MEEILQESENIERDSLSLNERIRLKYREDERVQKLIKETLNLPLPRFSLSLIFDCVVTHQSINFYHIFTKKTHRIYYYCKRLLNDKGELNSELYLKLKKTTLDFLKTIDNGFDEHEEEAIEKIKCDGKFCYIINKNHTKSELFKLFCDEIGNVSFKYDFSKPDLSLTTPKTNNDLQYCKVQITSLPITFGMTVENTFRCADTLNEDEDRCDSPETMTRKAYELEGVKDKLSCPGHKHKESEDGKRRSKKCNTTLYPVEKDSRYVDCYYYDINFEDEDGVIQACSAFSFNKLSPGYYESVIFSYTTHFKTPVYQIVDIKPIEDVKFNIPPKVEGKNYLLTFQEEIDNFIANQCGVKIWGLIPIKIALILQKLAGLLDYPLKNGIDFSGEKSCFPKGTLIKTPKGDIPIEKVSKVLAYDFDKKEIKNSECININTGLQEIYEIETEEGIIECTGNHLWYVQTIEGEILTKKTIEILETDKLLKIT